MNKSIDTNFDETYESSYWHVGVNLSNRFGTRIEWTSAGSDSVYLVPQARVNDVLKQLRSGKSPEEIEKSLPFA